ncbi:MAG: selenium-dependent molybdenum cofactor biosynthesis protein YqeB [Bacillota bacterium]
MIPRKIVIRGAGDLASGIAHRLFSSGFAVIMLELPKPLVVRRTVSFASVVYEGSIIVESVPAELCKSPEMVNEYFSRKIIPVLIDPDAKSLALLKPSIVVDAIMAKINRVTGIEDADLVIGIGPGFTAGRDVHAVVETKRGLDLGRVFYEGSAAEDTSEPGLINGYGKERLLRSTSGGIFKPLKKIGDLVEAGEIVASVGREDIKSAIDGMVRGMLYPGLDVKEGMKVGDIDPRGESIDYKSISDKARAVGGGVLEAIMHRYFAGNAD